ncbi:MAG: hypothetical protein KDD45_17530, partial [Bdellovibrionales bacterium]|nr:hypothetical protein [Bdellovibrionales bacterium]
MLKSLKLTSTGYSLIEVLIATSIVMMMALAMGTLIHNNQKQNKGLQQKLEAIELEQQVVRLLTDVAACECMFKDLDWTGSDINIPLLKRGCGGNLVSAGNLISPGGSGVKINTIQLENIDTANISADLKITFDSTSTIIPLKPIIISGQHFIL